MTETATTDHVHFIDGQWQPSQDGAFVPAVSPANRKELGRVAQGDRVDARTAVAAARRGHEALAKMSRWDLARACNRVADEIEKRRDILATTLAQEQGKPLMGEAYGEVDAAALGYREAGELFKWMAGEVIPVETPGKRAISYRAPRGVYGVITPWNFPVNIPVEYLAPCLAAGNAVVWVPAPSTSLCAARLMECIVEADLPAGAVNLVHGPGPVVGDEVVGHAGVDGIGFTGSPATGAAIAARGAGKPMLLELGGNGPVIVLDDADPVRAAEAAAAGSFFNAGQVCAATGRVLCARGVQEPFAEALLAAAQKVKIGDPMDPDTTMGPLNNPAVADKVEAHVADGLERGGVLLAGGHRMPDLGSDLFFAPTVIGDVPPGADLNAAETFGPVAPIVVLDSDDELIAAANAARHGLAASVFTRDLARAFRFGEAIQAGLVNINSPSSYWELHLPFGGAPGKDSGIGRLGGKHTLQAVTEIKTITFDIS